MIHVDSKESYLKSTLFSDFVSDFNELVLEAQKELEKNKIYVDNLLLVKMRFPGSLVV